MVLPASGLMSSSESFAKLMDEKTAKTFREKINEAIEKIKELDQDDEKYLEMMHQPILVDPSYPERLEAELGNFICHIVEQPREKAYRRSRVYRPRYCDDYLARAVDSDSLTMRNLISRIFAKIKNKL